MLENEVTEYLILFGVGAIGVVIHCLMKAKKLMARAKKANLELSFQTYVSNDWITIAISFLSIILWMALFGEAAQIYPKLENYVRLSFAGMGVTGSYFIQSFASVTEKWIDKNIDQKTDELDEMKK